MRAYEVWYHDDNQALFQKMGAAFGYVPKGVPGTYLGSQHWDGYTAAIGGQIEAAVQACLQTGCKDAGAGILTGGTPDPWPNEPAGLPAVSAPVGVTLALIAAGAILVVLTLVLRRLLRRSRF